jgi:hypothetical protein|tara:strand:+ start:226 stop:456 length:231 start_codon:yes stop_codon:yes gene_type:complete
MQLKLTNFVIYFNLFFLFPNFAYSYVGPGLGLGSVIVVLGLIGSLILAIFSLVYLPVKKFIHRKKEAKTKNKQNKN